MPLKTRRRRLILWSLAAIVAAVAVAALFRLSGWGIPCLFYTVTDWQCPGCGSSRAVLAYLQGYWADGWRYNPFFPLTVAYLVRVYVLAARRCWRGGRFAYHPASHRCDVLFLVLLIGWGVARNIL